MDLIQKLKDQVKPLGKKIVLPEYKDERVLKATEIILKEGFVTPVLVGNPAEIAEAAKAYSYPLAPSYRLLSRRLAGLKIYPYRNLARKPL